MKEESKKLEQEKRNKLIDAAGVLFIFLVNVLLVVGGAVAGTVVGTIVMNAGFTFVGILSGISTTMACVGGGAYARSVLANWLFGDRLNKKQT